MRKKFEIISFILGWFAVIAQFVLILQNRQADILETIIRFFTFFTILTNIIVALYFSTRIFKPLQNQLTFFNKKGTLTALTTFILIVGLVYQFVLRGIWEPKGMQRIVDELLHTIIPFLVLIYWLFYSKKEKIRFHETLIWLLYPLLYFIFVLVRGSYSNYYPYPFFNIQILGSKKVFLNSLLILILMSVIMAILVFVKNKLAKKETS